MNDLAIGNPNDCRAPDCTDDLKSQGAIYVFDGPLSGAMGTDDRERELTGISAGDWAGYSVDIPGDVDGDGYLDLATNAWRANLDGYARGAIYVVHGPLTTSASLSTAAATITGESNYSEFGAVCGPGDVNGDGTLDLLVDAQDGAPESELGVRVFLFDGDITGTVLPSSARARFVSNDGESLNYGAVLMTCPADLNADGLPDVLLSDVDYHEDEWTTIPRVFVFNGTTSGG